MHRVHWQLDLPKDLQGDRVWRTAAALMVGGTASVLGGGKFANGAMTGAFSRLFNDEMAEKQNRDRLNNAINQLKIDEYGCIKADITICVGLGSIEGVGAKVTNKFLAQLERQLSVDGEKSIYKTLQSLENRLQQHLDKLDSLQYKSSVEREIRTFKDQIETTKQFIKDKLSKD